MPEKSKIWKIGGIMTVIATALTIAISWQSLGLPVLATSYDIQQVTAYAETSRLLILQGEWRRVQDKIEYNEKRLEKTTHIEAQEALKTLIKTLKAQQKDIEESIKKIKDKKKQDA